MALRILQFGIVFAIGYYLGPASPFAGAVDVPEIPLSIQLEDPKDVTVSRGQAAILRCDAKSLLPAAGLQIAWLHNNVPIKINDTRRYIQDDGSLCFPKVGGGKKIKGLTGDYRCRVSSAQNVSMLSNPAKLKIASLGDFDKQPSNLSVPESQPAVLFCNINSVPTAQIKWEQNTKPLPHNTRYVPLPTGALLITKTHSSDAGSYRCIATNNLLKKTKHSKIVQLTVTSLPMKTVAPIFLPLDILPNTTVLVGENISLYCAVSGWPIPTVQWLNNNSIVISNSSVLQFRNASLQDSGNYTCAAYNSGGRRFQKYSLDVHQKPYFNITPTSRTYPPAKTVRLDCQAIGVPKPKISWLKNGEPLPNAARIKKHPTGLVISHTFTSDSGIYQCIAENAVGRIWAAAQLVPTLLDTPSPPENVQCRSYDDTSICLTWQSPQNVSVTAYSIYCYYIAMGGEVPGAEFVTNKTQLLASGLNGSTNYTCYIRLYSKIASDRSRQVTCRTGIKGRRNLQVIPVNETSVELSWSRVSTDVPCDGTKQFYKVQWKSKRSTSPSSEITDKFSYVISGLAATVEYEFRVIPAWLKTDASSWISFIPKGDSHTNDLNATDTIPLPPEHVEAAQVLPTSLNLTWNDINRSSRFYSICVYENQRPGDCNEQHLLKSASATLLITDLQPNTSYDFRVRAHDFYGGFSPFSESVTIRTQADVPSKVLNLNYEIVNETTACLRWQAPLHKNGRLTSYLILYTPNPNWPLEDWLNKSVPTTQGSLKGCWSGANDQEFSAFLAELNPDQEYTVYVRAASEVGLGNPMYPIKINTRNIKSIEQQPKSQDDVQYNQNFGIIIGVTIAVVCIVLCVICTILVRKRCLKTRAFARARMAASNNYYPAVAQYASEGSSVQVRLEHPSAAMHEIEHLVSDDCSNHIPPDTCAHLDTKGSEGFPNGHINGSAKPYINGHIANGIVHITENPRYYALECNGHADRQPSATDLCCTPYEEDSNSNLKTSKFHDLHRIFENSKTVRVPDMTNNRANRQCNFPLTRNAKDSKTNSSFKDVRPNG